MTSGWILNFRQKRRPTRNRRFFPRVSIAGIASSQNGQQSRKHDILSRTIRMFAGELFQVVTCMYAAALLLGCINTVVQ